MKVTFENIKTGFVVTFYRPKAEITPSKAGKTTQKTTQKIVEEIKKKPNVTRKELADIIGLTEEGSKYHLTKMHKKGLLRRIGPDKGGHWEIVTG